MDDDDVRIDDGDGFDSESGGVVGGERARNFVVLGYIMLVLSLVFILIAAIDTEPETEDYDSSEAWEEVHDSWDSRTDFYASAMVFLLLGGVITISGGLVQSGLDNSNVHPYIRIAVIVCGILLLIGLIELFTIGTLASML